MPGLPTLGSIQVTGPQCLLPFGSAQLSFFKKTSQASKTPSGGASPWSFDAPTTGSSSGEAPPDPQQAASAPASGAAEGTQIYPGLISWGQAFFGINVRSQKRAQPPGVHGTHETYPESILGPWGQTSPWIKFQWPRSCLSLCKSPTNSARRNWIVFRGALHLLWSFIWGLDTKMTSRPAVPNQVVDTSCWRADR